MRRLAPVIIVLVALAIWAVLPEQRRARQEREGVVVTDTPPRDHPSRVAPEPEVASGVGGVVTGADGKPLPDAVVTADELWPSGEIKRWRRAQARSDAEGRYAFELAPGHYAVHALHGGLHSKRHVLERARRVDLRVEAGPAELRVLLQPESAGIDLREFKLQLHASSEVIPVDDAGGWTLDRLHVGDVFGFSIRYEPDNFAWSDRPRVWPRAGGSRQVYEVAISEMRQRKVVRVDRFAWVRGRVVGPDGEFVMASVEVVSVGGNRMRGAGATFEVRALPDRPLSVFAVGSGGLGTAQPIELEPLDGGEVHELVVALEKLDGEIRGRLSDVANQPVAGVLVRVAIHIGAHWKTVFGKSDASGAVRIAHVVRGAGRVEVEIPKGKEWADPLSVSIDLTEHPIGDFGTIRLTAGGVVHGVGPPGSTVYAFPLDRRGERVKLARQSKKTSPDGSFRLPRLAPGRYVLVTAGKEHIIDVVEGGQDRVDLR